MCVVIMWRVHDEDREELDIAPARSHVIWLHSLLAAIVKPPISLALAGTIQYGRDAQRQGQAQDPVFEV